MENLLILLVLTGLFGFVDGMFDKFKIWYKIEQKSIAQRKLIYDLMNCRFCLRFHLIWILTLIIFIIKTFIVLEKFIPFTIPFIVSGFINLLKKR